jgi:hypothetical protein
VKKRKKKANFKDGKQTTNLCETIHYALWIFSVPDVIKFDVEVNVVCEKKKIALTIRII